MRDIAGPQRRSTATSTFGVSRRESHDASAFYERFTPPDLSTDTAVSPRKAVDEIFLGDARRMDQLDDASVALVVTSPPYFAGKDYETALGEGHVPATYAEYLAMLEAVFAECVRTLEPGGRIAVNVANLGRKPYRSLAGDVTWILQDRLRLLLRGEIVWVKARGAAGSCAWGSFQRPTNPVLRDLTERVVVASKGRFDRALPARRRRELGLPSEASISRDEFMEATTDLWEIPSESATRVGHPAPFPVELPQQLIQLYTYRGDLVLDPFMGSGSTAVAAVRTERHFAGYDTDPAYVAAAQRRAAEESERLAATPATAAPRVVVPPLQVAADSGPVGGDDAAVLAQALVEGRAARDIARELLERSGFHDVRANATRRSGIDVSFSARTLEGQLWCFEVAGGFTGPRSGLQRGDVLWRTLGKAAVHHHADRAVPLVVLTTGLPGAATPASAALAAVVGDNRPIRDVILLSSAGDVARLRRYARPDQA